MQGWATLSFLFLVVRPGAPNVASDRSVRSDALCPVRSVLLLFLLNQGEQRTHTMLVFLSDVPESDGGGHLHFPRLGGELRKVTGVEVF